MSQLGVVNNPRFAGLFWTQSIGAFTDNLFKNSLVLLVIFKDWTLDGLSSAQLNYLAGIIFIAPFFLFSATAGQLADKLEKAGLIRNLKVLEVAFSVLAIAGLFSHRVDLLLIVLLFFALQSTFFGPIKYGILPQLLNESELVAGNALVEMATNMAILAGTITAGLMINAFEAPTVGYILLAVSILGYLASRFIPLSPSEDPGLVVEWNPIVPTWRILKLLRERKSVFNSVLGISWFWALGGAVITLFPVYTKAVLSAGPEVETVLLAIFSIGVGIGSLACEKLSRGRLELGLVPLGSIGISLFCLDLWAVGTPWPAQAREIGVQQFFHLAASYRILFDLGMLAVSSGFFIVPLYTLIQQRSRAEVRSRIIAGNNIVNALFMVLSYIGVGVLTSSRFNWTIPQIYGFFAFCNAFVAIYIYTLIPEFFLRFVAFILSNILYRLKVTGEENIPNEGAVVLVCNHVSFVDWLLMAAAVHRPTHFVMWHSYYELPLIKFIFRGAGAIPISNSHVKPELTEIAVEKMSAYLEEGQVLCIFPEGKITPDGELMPFKSGIERIIKRDAVPVIPMAFKGLWGSNFSLFKGGFFKRFSNRPLRSKIELIIGPPVPPEEVSASHLRDLVLKLRGEER